MQHKDKFFEEDKFFPWKKQLWLSILTTYKYFYFVI